MEKNCCKNCARWCGFGSEYLGNCTDAKCECHTACTTTHTPDCECKPTPPLVNIPKKDVNQITVKVVVEDEDAQIQAFKEGLEEGYRRFAEAIHPTIRKISEENLVTYKKNLSNAIRQYNNCTRCSMPPNSGYEKHSFSCDNNRFILHLIETL